MNNKKLLTEKFNLHPFYSRIYSDIEIMFRKRFDKIEFLSELNNTLEQYGTIIQDTFNRKEHNASLDVTSEYSDDFNASFMSTVMNVDDKQFFMHRINMHVLYTDKLHDFFQGKQLEQKFVDYYTKTITSNFLHEMEHSIQELNISDLSKLGNIKMKQSSLNVDNDLRKYYSNTVEIDSYAADTARLLLNKVKDVETIKQNLNNDTFMQTNAGSKYPIYKELKDSDITIWKRYLRRIYQYLSEIDNQDIDNMYLFLMKDASNLGINIGRELLDNNIDYRTYAKNSNNFQYLKDNSKLFTQKYELIVEKYPKVWKKVDDIIFSYLNAKRN